MTINTDPQKIDQLLTRGVDEVIDAKNLRNKLLSGKKLRVKLGIDPTSPDLHLGRAVPLLKLRDFQELGHQIIFLVGNATGVIGDSSDKDAERPMLTHEDVKENMKKYVEQAGKIIDLDKAEIRYNADWLNKLGYNEIGHHADAFSLHEFLQRDNIKKRLDAGKRVSLRELLYPLMQGYDSIALEADVEIGGTDQRFNLLAGRVLQEQAGQEAQDIVMGNIIIGTDGRKMSSSWGNTIKLTDTPRDMGEKIMNMPDDIVPVYFENCTRMPQELIDEVFRDADPRYHKLILAGVIVNFYHGESAACDIKDYLQKKFVDKNLDVSEIEEVEIHKCERLDSLETVSILMVRKGYATSKSDAQRKIEQGGVKLDGINVSHGTKILSEDDDGKVLTVGKKIQIRLKCTK